MVQVKIFAFALVLLISSSAKGQFVCPRDDQGNCINGNLPNPDDCNSFYQCSNCFLYLQSCQEGLHYSPRIDACVYPHEAKCQVSPEPTLSPPPTTTTTTTQPLPTTVPTESQTDLTTFTTDSSIDVTTDGAILTTDEAETTMESYVTTQPPSVEKTVFFVARESSMLNHGIVEFKPIIDVACDFNRTSHSFSVRRSGVYFQSISAGAFESSKINMNLVVPGVDILRESTSHKDHDTTSRDILSSLNAGQDVHVINTGTLYSDPLLATSWTTIGLTDMMTNVQAFSVGRTNGYVGNMDPLTFDRVLANVGDGWDKDRNVYVVPVDGIYFFSLSVGAAAGAPFDAGIFVDNVAVELARLTRGSTSHDDTDLLSRAVLVRLTRGREVRVSLGGNGTAIHSDRELQTSFTGFLYDPILASNRVAWSLGRDIGEERFSQYIKALDFDKDIVNEGNAWNPSEKAVLAPYHGYYYVHVSAGAMQEVPVHLFVTVNEQPQVDLWRPGIYHNGTDTLSRSALLRLASGDRVQIAAATSTGIYSDNGVQTSFSGFFVSLE